MTQSTYFRFIGGTWATARPGYFEVTDYHGRKWACCEVTEQEAFKDAQFDLRSIEHHYDVDSPDLLSTGVLRCESADELRMRLSEPRMEKQALLTEEELVVASRLTARGVDVDVHKLTDDPKLKLLSPYVCRARVNSADSTVVYGNSPGQVLNLIEESARARWPHLFASAS